MGKIDTNRLEFDFHAMLQIDIVLDTVFFKHDRKILGFLDVLGEFGGIKEVLFVITAALLGPLTTHSFFVTAIQKLFITDKDDQ